MPILYFSRNPNPRLAAAVARYLDAPVTMEWAAPFHPDQAPFFLTLNPTQRIPILVEGDGTSLWEADAIACRLAQLTNSDFWRQGRDQPDMIRWISWGKETFVRACDTVSFETGTKLRYRLGLSDHKAIADGHRGFHDAAPILDRHLASRDWLTGASPSYADFRMATFLPWNDNMQLPLHDYPALAAWYARLQQIPAWSDPFDGLDVPELPPIPA